MIDDDDIVGDLTSEQQWAVVQMLMGAAESPARAFISLACITAGLIAMMSKCDEDEIEDKIDSFVEVMRKRIKEVCAPQ